MPSFQEKFWRSSKRIRFCAIGNQEGKTHSSAVEAALYALGEHPHKKIRTPNYGRIVTAKSHKDGIEDEIMPKIREVVGSKDIKRIIKDKQGRESTIIWRSDSYTHLMSAEQDDVAFESKTLDWAWFDEPMRRAIYIATMRGLMKSGGHLWWSATLLDEPWIYDEIMLPAMEGTDPDIELFEGTGNENPHIPQKERDSFYSKLGEDELEVRKFGRPKHLMGRVIKEYDPKIHRIKGFDIPYHWPVWRSIDPHTNKPHGVLYLTVSPEENFYCCNEIYYRANPDDLAAEILSIDQQYQMVDSLIDTSAEAVDHSKISLRQMLDDLGVPTRKAQKNTAKFTKKNGIFLINQLFKQKRLFVFDNCVRLHKELQLYTYQKNKRDGQKVLEEPEKKFDDQIDNLRYILSEKPDYSGVAKVIDYVG